MFTVVGTLSLKREIDVDAAQLPDAGATAQGDISARGAPRLSASPAEPAGIHFEAARECIKLARKSLSLPELLRAIRSLYVMDSLESCDYNFTNTAKELGVHRNTLHRMLLDLKLMGEVKKIKKARRGKQHVSK